MFTKITIPLVKCIAPTSIGNILGVQPMQQSLAPAEMVGAIYEWLCERWYETRNKHGVLMVGDVSIDCMADRLEICRGRHLIGRYLEYADPDLFQKIEAIIENQSSEI